VTGRLPTVAEEPAGLLYVAAFVTDDEERDLVASLEALDFDEVRMRGQAALRTVHHFGFRYEYEGWRLVEADPLPEALTWLRDRAGELAGVGPQELTEVLVTRYPQGAGIGWHRDAPLFGPKVVGVSLLAPCRMRFQQRAAGVRKLHQLELAPRSAYVLAGAARRSWQHSIPATPALRYSVTFRTVIRTG
jgi:alkylated DNA repair dioxygenase AlkB